MALITYPLNNINYTAEDAELFHCTRTSGVWAKNSFPLSATGTNNKVTVGKGIAWINNEEFSGKVVALKESKSLDLGVADSTYPRIDVIAIQYNTNNNSTDVIIKKGTPSTNPVQPAIVRNGSVYELYLASIYRPAGATVITASNVTDLRMDKSVCGLMADSVTNIDTSAINDQILGIINDLKEAIRNIDTEGVAFIPSFARMHAERDFEVDNGSNYFNPLPEAHAAADIERGGLFFDVEFINGYDGTKDASVFGIKVGKGVKAVQLNFSTRIQFDGTETAETTIWVSPRKVSADGKVTIYGYAQRTIRGGMSETLSISSCVDVQEGDFFYALGYKGKKSDLLTVRYSGNATSMSIGAIG